MLARVTSPIPTGKAAQHPARNPYSVMPTDSPENEA